MFSLRRIIFLLRLFSCAGLISVVQISEALEWARPLPLHYCGLSLTAEQSAEIYVREFPNPNQAEVLQLQSELGQAVTRGDMPRDVELILRSFLDDQGHLEEMRYVIAGILVLNPFINWRPEYDRPMNGKWDETFLERKVLGVVADMSLPSFLTFAARLKEQIKNPAYPKLPLQALLDPHHVVSFKLQIPTNATRNEIVNLVEDLGSRIGVKIPLDRKHIVRLAPHAIRVSLELPLHVVADLRKMLVAATSVRSVSIASVIGWMIGSWETFAWPPIGSNRNSH